MKEALRRWLRYRQDIGKPLKSPDSVSSLLRKWSAKGEAAFCAAVEASIANAWQGLFEPRGETQIHQATIPIRPTRAQQTEDMFKRLRAEHKAKQQAIDVTPLLAKEALPK